eukprot:GHVO01032162.1.p1 GENE.GHVO01032162.1~~GHVO01032162.1.p1  ORF type:complete len:268 (+),score=48.55 GHVO01032162.1:22-804(+)
MPTHNTFSTLTNKGPVKLTIEDNTLYCSFQMDDWGDLEAHARTWCQQMVGHALKARLKTDYAGTAWNRADAREQAIVDDINIRLRGPGLQGVIRIGKRMTCSSIRVVEGDRQRIVPIVLEEHVIKFDSGLGSPAISNVLNHLLSWSPLTYNFVAKASDITDYIKASAMSMNKDNGIANPYWMDKGVFCDVSPIFERSDDYFHSGGRVLFPEDFNPLKSLDANMISSCASLYVPGTVISWKGENGKPISRLCDETGSLKTY